MKRLPIALIAILTLVIAVSSASAQVALFDQSDFDEAAPGFFNSESGSPPFGSTNHVVNHVTAPGAWNIQKITTYYSALDPSWGGGIFQGYVHIWPKSGPLPLATDDPTASMLVTMSAVMVGTHFEVSTVGLDINIAAGEYWIGITPIAPGGGFGPEIHLSNAATYGDASASYDVYAFPGPPAWFTMNPGVDAAILIEGSGPVPNETKSVGSVKASFGN